MNHASFKCLDQQNELPRQKSSDDNMQMRYRVKKETYDSDHLEALFLAQCKACFNIFEV